MNIINNRYKMIKQLEKKHFISKFLVEDLLDSNKKLDLYMFERYLFSKDSFEFLKYYFSYINSLSDILFLRVITFSSVKNIDGIKKNGTFLFYCTSHLEETRALIEWTSEGEIKRLINVVGSMITSINYSGLRGLNYSSFNPQDLFVEISGNQYFLRHVDLIQKEFEYIINGLYTKTLDRNSIQLDWNKMILNTQEFAYMLLSFVEGRREVEKNNFESRIEAIAAEPFFCVEEGSEELYLNLLSFIKELYNNVWGCSFEEVYKIYLDYSDKFSLSFNIEESDKLSLLSKNGLLIGREFQLDKAFHISTNSMRAEGRNVLLISGKEGLGKTRFLHELENLYNIENITYISSFKASREEPNAVLEDFYAGYSDLFTFLYFGEKRREYIEKINEIRNHFFVVNNQEKTHLDFKAILQTTSLILNQMNNERIIFLVDNIEFLNDFTIDAILYFLSDNILKEKLFFVFTINPHDVDSEHGIHRFIKILRSMKSIYEMELLPLDYKDTNLMIKSILFSVKNSERLSHQIYMESLGNPSMISKLIRQYVLNYYINLNRVTGFWEFDEESVHLEYDDDWKANKSVYFEYLNDFTGEQHRLLSILSCFHESAGLDKLSKLSGLSLEEVSRCIDKYSALGLVDVIFEGAKRSVKIANTSFRNMLYQEISEEERREYHEKILNQLNGNIESDIKEMLSQYRLLGRFEEGKRLAIKLAESKNINPQVAIIYFNIALEFVSEDEYDDEARIRLDLAANYLYSGLFKDATETLDAIIPFYHKIGISSYKEEFLYQKLRLAMVFNDSDAIIKCIEILESTEEKHISEFTILWRLLQASLCIFFNDIKEAIQIYSDLIEQFANSSDPRIMRYISEAYRNMAKHSNDIIKDEERLRLYDKALMLSNQAGDIFNSLVIGGNIAYIHLLKYNDYRNSVDVLMRNLEQAQREMFPVIEIFAMNNIGYAYMMQGDYKRASEFLKKAFIRSEISGINIEKVEILIELFRCYLRFKDFQSISKTWNEHIKFIKNIKYTDENYKFIIFRSDYYFSLGDYQKSALYLEKLFEEGSNLPSADRRQWEYIHQILMMIIKKEYNEELLVDYVHELEETYHPFTTQDSCYRLCRYLEIVINTFGVEMTSDAVKRVLFYEYRSKTNLTRMYFQYFKAISNTQNINEKLEILLLCEYYLKEYPNEAIGISINYEVAKALNESGYKNELLLCMYEAFINCVKVLKAVPKKYLELYFSANKFSKIFKFFENYIEDESYYFNDTDLPDYNLTEIESVLQEYCETLLVEDSNFIDLIVTEKLRYHGFEDDLRKMIQNVSSHRMTNIDRMLEFFAIKILSTEAFILLDDGFGSYELFSKFLDKSSYIDYRVLIKYLGTNSIRIDNRNALIKEYPEITQLTSFPIYESKAGRAQKIKGFIVFLSNSNIHVFNKKTMQTLKCGVNLLTALVRGYELKKSVSIDKLTGALTRRYLFEELEALYREGASRPCSIAMLDLDHFKRVNDNYGHQVGDMVLKTVIQIAIDNLPGRCKIGRYGGEEFIILFPGMEINQVMSICGKILQEVEKTRYLAYSDLKITVSMGIKKLDLNEDLSVKEWIEKADSALYYAKYTGRNKCIVYKENLEEFEQAFNPIQGILTSDELRDTRVIVALTELILLKREKRTLESNLYDILTRSMELLGVQEGGMILLSENGAEKPYFKSLGQNRFYHEIHLDRKLLNRIKYFDRQISTVDWNDLSHRSKGADFPIWNSVLAIRIMSDCKLMGILYYKSPYYEKRFDDADLNFANIIANITSMYLNQEEGYEEDQQTI